ncbi:putative lipase/esterase [Dietzia cinnamea P4]|nr:putative lipase/esterase [Dietzia cinnamea P4]
MRSAGRLRSARGSRPTPPTSSHSPPTPHGGANGRARSRSGGCTGTWAAPRSARVPAAAENSSGACRRGPPLAPAAGSTAILSLLARRLVAEADRRIAVTRRPSLSSRFQRAGLQLVVRPVLTIAPFDEKWIRALRAVATTASRATGSRRRTRPAHGAPVPGLWIDGADDAPGLLVLHGGGYVAGSPDTHATMAKALARLAGTTTYVPDYRLAPEHRYPAALDDAEAAFRHLAERVGGAERVAIAGDSAGGGLALGLLDRLRGGGERPAALALISPWVDLTEPLGGERSGGALDPLMPPSIAADCRDAYAGDTPVDDPGISPARRPLDASAPAVSIVCGGDDFVVDDVRAFVDASTARGATVDLRVWPGMVHCFPVVAGTPEGASALAVLAGHIRTAVTATAVDADTVGPRDPGDNRGPETTDR